MTIRFGFIAKSSSYLTISSDISCLKLKSSNCYLSSGLFEELSNAAVFSKTDVFFPIAASIAFSMIFHCSRG